MRRLVLVLACVLAACTAPWTEPTTTTRVTLPPTTTTTTAAPQLADWGQAIHDCVRGEPNREVLCYALAGFSVHFGCEVDAYREMVLVVIDEQAGLEYGLALVRTRGSCPPAPPDYGETRGASPGIHEGQ